MWILLLPLAALFALSIEIRRQQRWKVWEEAAASCSLEEVMIHPRLGRSHLTARKGALEVRFESTEKLFDHTRVVVRLPTGFWEVRIRREVVSLLREVEVGDAAFDESFRIEGPEELVLALLDAEARRLFLCVRDSAVWPEIEARELRAEMTGYQLPFILSLLLELGQRLARQVDVAQRLGENAQRDAESDVRLRNLSVLVREFQKDPRTVEVLRAACNDSSPQIRLRAATKLGAEGRGVLLKLAGGLEDDGVSAKAIMSLGKGLSFERTQAILAQALRQRHGLTASACLKVVSQSGAAETVGVLAGVLVRAEGEVAVAAAAALGATADPSAEAPLIAALQRDQADLQVTAAQALGSLGSVAAVLPLKEAAQGSAERDLRRAARQAIAEIQSRLQGASPGQLSLAGSEAGQLSLADAEAGQLSLAEAEAGQLSMANDPAGQLSIPAAEPWKPPGAQP